MVVMTIMHLNNTRPDGDGDDGGGDDNYAHNVLVHTQCVSLKSQNTELVVVMKIWPTMEPP